MAIINSNKRISKNIITSIAQVLFVGLSYLFIYKYLIITLGVSQLGIWSIILATSSVANIANFGIASGLVKFVADYNATDKKGEIPKLVLTALTSLFLFFIIFIIFIYFIGINLFKYFIEPQFIDIATKIFPYSLACLLINSLASVFSSVLEGIQKNYIKNYIIIFTTILFVILTYYFVPKYKLLGVAYAQLIQSLVLLIIVIFIFKKKIKEKLLKKENIDFNTFKLLYNFGIKFQGIYLLLMFYEPITKGLISKFGGLVLLGYYEMASRLINQIRAVIVNSNQIMIPVVAHTLNTKKNELRNLYKSAFNLTFIVDVLLIINILAFAPFISLIWIGHSENMFTYSMLILCISTFINILNTPSYFNYIGQGKLNQILISHLIMSLLNLVLGLLLGKLFGGYSVILATGFSLAIGSIYLINIFHVRNNISVKLLFNKENYLILCSNLLLSILSFFYFEEIKINSWVKAFFLIIIIIIVNILLYLTNKKIKKTTSNFVLNKVKKK